MHSYVDLYFTPEGISPLEISERLKRTAGLTFILGPHDLVFEWKTVDEFREILGKVHDALQGTGVTYRIETITDEPGFLEPVGWPPPLVGEPPTHPGF
jgi:hypothetical protein